MEMPKDRTDLREWVKFFQETRSEVWQRDGVDIANDTEAMWGWFVVLYQNGHDEARTQRMFKDAGVDNIEDYMKTLMNTPEGVVVEATEALIPRGSGRPNKAFVAKNIAEMDEFLASQKAKRLPLAVIQFDENEEVVGLIDIDETRLKIED